MRFSVLAVFIVLAYAEHEKYIGWTSYYVSPATEHQMKSFRSLVEKYDLDVLSGPNLGREGVLLVKPEHEIAFIQGIISAGITYRIHADDVKGHLDYDDQLIKTQSIDSMARHGGSKLPYDNYQKFNVIDAYLDHIGNVYPEVATVVTAAKSFEGRPIKYVKISSTNFKDIKKPVIFIDGGTHAREWITSPTVTWAIHKLVEDVNQRDLLEQFDWILLPIVNPDGYVYTFTNDRFWRKNRSTDNNVNRSHCPGVDDNRNYDFFWNTVGASSNPCSDVYAGPTAFSEAETRVVRDLLKEHLSRIALYITMHSFGNFILYPWAHDGSLPKNDFQFRIVGTAMASAMDKNSIYFPPYTVGNTAEVIRYQSSGASSDYGHQIGVPLSFTIELPGLARDLKGFHLEPQYIEQVCRDTWEGIVVGARKAGNFFSLSSSARMLPLPDVKASFGKRH